MKKVLLALVIVMITILAVTTGCQKKAEAPSGPSQLTVEIFDRGMDGGRSMAYNNAWTDWIKAKVLTDLNIEVTFVPVGRWSENTDIINMMASSSAPDLCYTYNTDMITNFKLQGGIFDLTHYIDQYLPDMKKLLGADPALQGQDLIYRDRDPVTGRVFSVPSVVVNVAQRNLFIRKDWLDILGLPLPTTTEQFHAALIAFRDNADRLPGSGGRNTIVPYGQDSDARWGFSPIVHAFFDPNISDRDFWINYFSDRPITMPGYKDGLRMMNQWYN